MSQKLIKMSEEQIKKMEAQFDERIMRDEKIEAKDLDARKVS